MCEFLELHDKLVLQSDEFKSFHKKLLQITFSGKRIKLKIENMCVSKCFTVEYKFSKCFQVSHAFKYVAICLISVENKALIQGKYFKEICNSAF